MNCNLKLLLGGCASKYQALVVLFVCVRWSDVNQRIIESAGPKILNVRLWHFHLSRPIFPTDFTSTLGRGIDTCFFGGEVFKSENDAAENDWKLSKKAAEIETMWMLIRMIIAPPWWSWLWEWRLQLWWWWWWWWWWWSPSGRTNCGLLLLLLCLWVVLLAVLPCHPLPKWIPSDILQTLTFSRYMGSHVNHI